ncbi:hypothetical protein PUNSTDRAFT_138228 [Punctularia strigosozonata HHB-11173 SS5]|uniref:Uncharacterized protein n=1 Tax=Punctularia strigosozonata (strain HHB-11173) TaxID=741275 RepID=R7S4A0_PUNST|nr:uncharacterized protein PUNSTDRAFT_138228 [Punctularia strigosozonata HHB-11173 SS5]EIN05048.1 hypothetical protein PUNSTDRAFT_138228 [Punctularia strigosozonata HHB-11173 SS5]
MAAHSSTAYTMGVGDGQGRGYPHGLVGFHCRGCAELHFQVPRLVADNADLRAALNAVQALLEAQAVAATNVLEHLREVAYGHAAPPAPAPAAADLLQASQAPAVAYVAELPEDDTVNVVNVDANVA